MPILPRAEVEKIIRKAGAERVSLDAPDALCTILEDKAIEIVERALIIARHARGKKKNGGKKKRKTLKLTSKDILLAVS